MEHNKLRELLRAGRPSTATRLYSRWPFFAECAGMTGNFDYIEFLAEYTPFVQEDLENFARAAELHDTGTMIKVDFQNRGYVAQKAVGAGFQAINFTDHHSAREVRETLRMMKPETPRDGGMFGYPARRFIGCRLGLSQEAHAQRLRDVVMCFMIEKKSAVEDIEAICSVPGVDMVQFGPSDFAMSSGWQASERGEEIRAAERHVIEVALRHGVQPRCEINAAEDARYYIDLGVRHFCLGDETKVLGAFWRDEGKKMRDASNGLLSRDGPSQ